jgi:hypothetical protein
MPDCDFPGGADGPSANRCLPFAPRLWENAVIRHAIRGAASVVDRQWGQEARVAVLQEQAERKPSDEQERILAVTDVQPRQLFIGAAGTGKTFLAQEKARRLAAEGKKVFLTWFNKREHDLFAAVSAQPNVTAAPFLDYLLQDMAYRGKSLDEPDSSSERQAFYEHILVNNAADVYDSLPVEERFDAVIVDEGQEFRAHWHGCLAAMLKPDGQLHVFADPEQNYFADGEPGLITRVPVSEHRLSVNFRSAPVINDFLSSLHRLPTSAQGEVAHQAVQLRPWNVSVDQPSMIETDLLALKRQGVDLKQAVILSPYRLAKGSLANIQTLAGLPIRENPITSEPAIRYSTIRNYKGLQADVVLVIDIWPDDSFCLPADVYVAASRARVHLGVYHRADWQLGGGTQA